MGDPFWEAGYRDETSASVFGPPSAEIVALAPRLPPGASVLDLGCGDGRNALFLLGRGLRVTAVDVSPNAVRKLERQAGAHGKNLTAIADDVRRFRFAEPFDVVIAHGLLHLLPRPDWHSLIGAMQQGTAASGYNVVAVFTDALPPPADLLPFMKGLFREGELFEQYAGWQALERRAYVLEDEHPGGVQHRHPLNKIVARKPGP